MMGVYINMEMPESCYDCDFAYQDQDSEHNVYWTCAAVHKSACMYERRDDCPLVSVPPHGRLIDADALLERFEKEEKAADEHGRDFSFSFKSGGENCTEWWPVQQMLMDAPTIIPAEEGET